MSKKLSLSIFLYLAAFIFVPKVIEAVLAGSGSFYFEGTRAQFFSALFYGGSIGALIGALILKCIFYFKVFK